MGYRKVSALAQELGLTPTRLHQLIREHRLKAFTLVPDGEKYISDEECERFKSLERRRGRPKNILTTKSPLEIFGPVSKGEEIDA